MSTPPAPSPVKQALLERLRRDAFPALEQLVADLPEALTEAAQAERQIRTGALATARLLLAAWGQAADTAVARPDCSACRLPMRHKGSKRARSVTTLGTVRFRRSRFRCEGCGAECYPHGAVLRCLGHAVSWPLAQVVGRLAAQLGSFEQARDGLAEDYGGPAAARGPPGWLLRPALAAAAQPRRLTAQNLPPIGSCTRRLGGWAVGCSREFDCKWWILKYTHC
jgi:hypothetical protein